MRVDGGSWIRCLLRRISSCGDKLGAGGKRKPIQRTQKRYDDDGRGEDVGLRLVLLAAVTTVWRRERFRHKRTDVERQRKEGRSENTRTSALCKDPELHSVLST